MSSIPSPGGIFIYLRENLPKNIYLLLLSFIIRQQQGLFFSSGRFPLFFANYVIARDFTPGGIYIVGLDVSPDSTDLTLLYYSPDAGPTHQHLAVRDTSDWAGLGGIGEIAVDKTTNVVYLSRTDPIDDRL